MQEQGQIFKIGVPKPWFAYLVNYIVRGEFPPHYNRVLKERMKSEVKYYVWDDPFLWKYYFDKVIQQCLPDDKVHFVLNFVILKHVGGISGLIRQLGKS